MRVVTDVIGPTDLLDLNNTVVVWAANGITVQLAAGIGGVYFEIVARRDTEPTVADVISALRFLPGNALLRDSFADDDDVCVNFWNPAA